MTQPYLVTGASGFAGRHLLQSRAEGTEAIALVRDPSDWVAQGWSAQLDGVTTVQGSLFDLSLIHI